MAVVSTILLYASLLLTSAIAGFFYAYWCSVMVGLAATDAATGMAAMQAINATVRNAMFAPAFFGPMLVLPLAAAFGWRAGRRRSALLLLAAFAVYAAGAFYVTLTQNVPLNTALAAVPPGAADIWAAYLADWGWWNGFRTAASFLSLGLVGAALWAAGRQTA